MARSPRRRDCAGFVFGPAVCPQDEVVVPSMGDAAMTQKPAALPAAAPPAVKPQRPRRLPPLNALRAFEVSARHLSFTRAADELFVTPAAVSQQVRQLEEILGYRLFERGGKALELTAGGAALLPGIRDGFDRLADAVQRAGGLDRRQSLKVSVAPSFAAKWLLPRLDDFALGHPEIDLHVDASMALVDLRRDEVDAAIRYGSGQYPGLVVERILAEEVVVVCRPDLPSAARPLATPADLAHHTLLHDDSLDNDHTCPTWEMWLRAAGVTGVEVGRGLRFNQSSLVLEAALHGRGVALAKAALAEADLAAGRLVRPLGRGLPVAFAYYLATTEVKARDPRVLAFKAWLAEQTAATPATP
jgi:LysR family glycine cleavage system transcriptional activator